VVPEAPLEQTESGFAPAGKGWFVLNARDARWHDRPGRRSTSLTGRTDFEAETYFPQLGVNLAVIEPGAPNSIYHWETEQEAFLVLAGEALLIVEGERHSAPPTRVVVLRVPPARPHRDARRDWRRRTARHRDAALCQIVIRR
jgi:hypothetical protein